MKDIPIAFSADTQDIYKKEFKRELLADLNKYEKAFIKGAFQKRNGRRALQFVWAFAKTADPTIKNFNRWKKQFSEKEGIDIFVRANEALGREVIGIWQAEE